MSRYDYINANEGEKIMTTIKREHVKMRVVTGERHFITKLGVRVLAIHYTGPNGLVQFMAPPGAMTPLDAQDAARALLCAAQFAAGLEPEEEMMTESEEVEQKAKDPS